MRVAELRFTHQLPISLEDAWAFFSTPKNLNEITPEDMHFEILTDLEELGMYPGMIIRYNVKPVGNIPLNWVTEITQVEHQKYFIDEQRFGPYAFWHHQHHFEENEKGTLMADILHYKVPFGPIGSIADAIFVRKKINEIFKYRTERLNFLFPS